MPIAKMKRLQVLALERDHDALLRQLERMGCVEISEPDAPDAPESLRRCDSETADCLARQRQVQTAIDALRRAAPPKKAPLLAPRPAIGEAEYLSETGLADGLPRFISPARTWPRSAATTWRTVFLSRKQSGSRCWHCKGRCAV